MSGGNVTVCLKVASLLKQFKEFKKKKSLLKQKTLQKVFTKEVSEKLTMVTNAPTSQNYYPAVWSRTGKSPKAETEGFR